MDISRRRLLATLDCTKELPPDQYYDCGDVKVVDGPAGKYREAEAKPLSRFGYRFQIENVGQPHVAVIRYPDDKQRFIIINDGTTYDLSTGITTGWSQPLSNEILELRQVFWPRWKDCSINFMSWGHGEPAAAQSIEIYELDDLPALEITPGDTGECARREFGIQYEDPCGIGAAEGAMTFDQWLDRIVTHARHTGQTLFSYPICWYHGPLFPSKREPSDVFNIVVDEDRRTYCPWTSEPPDWPSVLLERFGKEGLEFTGALTLLRLGSLMQKMNIDLDAIKGGADTINNMLWNDRVQAGTMDWTKDYNTKNYDRLVAYHEEERSLDDFPWAYGEKTRHPYHPGPMFNPLHPVVREAIIGFVREIGERYAKFPAFKGIAINMWAPTIIWFGSIHSGYDDYTTSLFEQETGIEIPVDKSAPDRFSRRYSFLTYACRRAWIDWRCRKIRELVCDMRDAFVEARPDMRLTLNLWSEPYIPAVLGRGKAHHQLYARPSCRDLWLDAGIDPSLFEDGPNIEFDLQTEGGQRDRTDSLREDAPLEAFCMFRDHDYLDQQALDAIHSTTKPGVFIFNSWHEAWGKHKWFRCDENDPRTEALSYTYGKKAEGIFRANSEYPEDGFWWDSQARITHAFQPGVHFMEQYAHAVAELDACRITRGGLFLDKAHNDELRKFALAYNALPAEKFETVGDSTDPVAVRTCARDGKRYFYLQNRDYYPVTVDITFTASPGSVTEAGVTEPVAASEHLRLVVGPYELRSFTMSSEIDISGFVAVPPVEIAAAIRRDAEKVLESIESVAASGKHISGMDRLAQQMRIALKEGRIAWLRRATTSYIARKCAAE